MRVAEAITLSPDERIILDQWATGRSFPFRVVQRAQIIRMAADGVLSRVIARTLRISRPTVQLWRQRFLALRLPGLEKDAPRPGRIPRISHRKVSAVIHATLHSTPPNATHWSARSLAKAQGLSKDAIHPNSGNSNKELSAHEFSICSGYFRVCVKHTVPVQPWRRASFWCK